MNSKVSLFLMTQKGYYVLQKFIADFGILRLDCVIIGRDSHINNDYYNEIVKLCEENNIKYYNRLSKYHLQSKYAISISWKWIIKSKARLIVLHDSLLPKYRGFAPVVNSLINNEKKVGVTAIFASNEYDKGEIIAQKSKHISYPITIKETITLLLPIYYEVVKDVITKIVNNISIQSIPQNENLASYSLWRDENDYEINWFEKSSYIRRFIDAVGDPYSGASSYLDGRKIRILVAQEELDVNIENRIPGKVIFLNRGTPVVVCGEGLLRIEKMIDDETRMDLIPMTKLRVRFR
jgi:methionyl-tRNA formyltransferase